METDDNFKELAAAVDAADKKRRQRLAQDNSDRSNAELVINTRLDDVIVERDASKGCIQQHNTLDQHASFWRPAIQRYGAWCTACFLFCAVLSAFIHAPLPANQSNVRNSTIRSPRVSAHAHMSSQKALLLTMYCNGLFGSPHPPPAARSLLSHLHLLPLLRVS